MDLGNLRSSVIHRLDNLGKTEILAGVAAASAVTYSVWKLYKSANLPPGPPGLPLIGNYLQLGPDPPRKFMEWSHIYGKIISIKLASRRMVIIHDYDLAKDVFSQDNTSGRDQHSVLEMIFKGRGLIQEEGTLFKEQRRFARTALHNLPQSLLQDAILTEVTEFTDYLSTINSIPVDLRQHLIHAVANVISITALGVRFPHSDVCFNQVSNLIGNTTRSIGQLTPLAAWPFWEYLPTGEAKTIWKSVKIAVKQLVNFVQPAINAHKQPDVGQPLPPDYVRMFLEEQKSQKDLVQSTFTDEQLLMSVLNLFAPGAETMTTSLLWSILFMLENPSVAAKVRQQLHDTCLKQVVLEDKEQLPYVEATLQECLRLGSTVPLGIYHTNFDEMDAGGYRIPARSVIVANTYAIHRDPQYWSDPEVFRPERFIVDGKLKVPAKGYMPFYVGKRSCLAEHFAKTILFLFFANLMHRYDFQPSGPHPSSDEAIYGLLRSPFPYKVLCVETKQSFITETHVRLA